MSSSTEILDSLLPLLQPEGRELHLNAAIVEVMEAAQLAELAANPRIRRFLLARLSDTVALVDPRSCRRDRDCAAGGGAHSQGAHGRWGMKLGHVLESSLPVKTDPSFYGSRELKEAARFWAGKEAYYYNKDKCIAALTRTMADGDTARSVVAGLTEKERQILGIFARYGPTVSGGLLTVEVCARGIMPPPPKNQASGSYYQAYSSWSNKDPVPGLRAKFILVSDYFSSYSWSSYRHEYPQLTLHPSYPNASNNLPLLQPPGRPGFR